MSQNSNSCQLVNSGYGTNGKVSVRTQPVVTGLTVPWDIAFLPNSSDWLVSERPGRLRLIRNGELVSEPILSISTVSQGEGGLLGIALDPEFNKNSFFYLYYTRTQSGKTVNRVQKYRLSAAHLHATPDQVILDHIPGASVHDGGRIQFGPDKLLYVSTGDATVPASSRNGSNLSGKILRIRSDGTIPSDNPEPGNAWFIKGLRNPQAFAWLNHDTLIIADNGPSGEYQGRTGGDEINVARKGYDLGWPTTWHCEVQTGLTPPILSWVDPVPLSGLLRYSGNDIPSWKGSILVGSTGAEHLHRIVLDENNEVTTHEVYLQGDPPQGLGRLRSIIQGPNGELYVTTTNCDGRGSCSSTIRDGIFRVLENLSS